MTLWNLQGPLLIVLGIAGGAVAVTQSFGIAAIIVAVNAVALLGIGIIWTRDDFA